MKNTVVAEFPFLEGDERHSGKVSLARTEYPDRTVIGLRLVVGKQKPLRLPRNRLSELIDALRRAEEEGNKQYQLLLEELNSNGL